MPSLHWLAILTIFTGQDAQVAHRPQLIFPLNGDFSHRIQDIHANDFYGRLADQQIVSNSVNHKEGNYDPTAAEDYGHLCRAYSIYRPSADSLQSQFRRQQRESLAVTPVAGETQQISLRPRVEQAVVGVGHV